MVFSVTIDCHTRIPMLVVHYHKCIIDIRRGYGSTKDLLVIHHPIRQEAIFIDILNTVV